MGALASERVMLNVGASERSEFLGPLQYYVIGRPRLLFVLSLDVQYKH